MQETGRTSTNSPLAQGSSGQDGAADSSREPARRLRNRVIILWWLDDGRLSRLYSVVEQVTGSVLIERWQHSGRLLLRPGADEGRC